MVGVPWSLTHSLIAMATVLTASFFIRYLVLFGSVGRLSPALRSASSSNIGTFLGSGDPALGTAGLVSLTAGGVPLVFSGLSGWAGFSGCAGSCRASDAAVVDE